MKHTRGANVIDALTATAERDGKAPLPALTQADLCALGAAEKALLCQPTWDWWLSLGERGREETAANSLSLLAFRELLMPARGRAPAVPVPELGLILAARSDPAPLVTCQLPGQDATSNPRFFGMTQRSTGLRVLVCELLTDDPAGGPGNDAGFGNAIIYSLVTPGYAATMLATWARIASRFADAEWPAIDIHAHDPGGQLVLDRHEILLDGELFCARRPAIPQPPQRLDEMMVTQLLTTALTGAVR
jgi:hypothetical protein